MHIRAVIRTAGEGAHFDEGAATIVARATMSFTPLRVLLLARPGKVALAAHDVAFAPHGGAQAMSAGTLSGTASV